MDYADLYRKVRDHPFKPFRIRMVNSTTYDNPTYTAASTASHGSKISRPSCCGGA
jgi:hypothetical protein